MTSGDGGLWLNLYVLVLSMLVGIGGLLHAADEKNFGWRVFDITVAIHALNCISLLIHFVQ